MSAPVYGPIDVAVKLWLLGSDVAELVKQPDGTYAIHMAMPRSAPVPSIIINLVGGGPINRSDLPACRYRVSFTCYGTSRESSSLIARTVIDLLEDIGQGFTGILSAGVWLGAADVLNLRWLPDPDSGTPRYIVDALITTVT